MYIYTAEQNTTQTVASPFGSAIKETKFEQAVDMNITKQSKQYT